MPLYPTNAYTTIDLTTDNKTEYREKRVTTIVDAATGLTTTDHPTRSLYDFANLSNNTVNDFLYTLCIKPDGEVEQFKDAIEALTVKQNNYFTKEKQPKLLRLTERIRRLVFELQRLNSDAVHISAANNQNLPDANESLYPTSRSIRSFLNR